MTTTTRSGAATRAKFADRAIGIEDAGAEPPLLVAATKPTAKPASAAASIGDNGGPGLDDGTISKTFRLSSPLIGANGERIDDLEIREATLGDALAAEDKAQNDAEERVIMIARLSGLPVEIARTMRRRDERMIAAWVGSLTEASTEIDRTLPDESERTFTLDYPIPGDKGRMMSTLTLFEPDLACEIAMEKFPKPIAKLAAALATQTGLSRPMLGKLKARDTTQMAVWFGRFFIATASMETEDGAM